MCKDDTLHLFVFVIFVFRASILKNKYLEARLKVILLFILAINFTACSLKEAAENDFKTKTQTKPFAPSKTLAERFGDGDQIKFTVKIPLTEDSVGYYDVEDVLGNRDLNGSHKNFFERMYDGMKLSMFNLFVKMGYSNKIKFSSSFDFPQIDKRFIKSARVKKVFFTTEDCREGEDDCNDGDTMGSNFNLVDKFFVNLSSSAENDVQTTMIQLSDKEFRRKTKQAFKQTSLSIKESIQSSQKENKDFGEVNLVSFSNDVPYLNLKTLSAPEDAEVLNFDVNENKDVVAKYLKSEKFNHLIKRVQYGTKRKNLHSPVRRRIRGIDVYLRQGAKPSAVFKLISDEQSPLVKKMFILRLNGNYVEAKNYFKSKKFEGVVQDTTMIGRSLFVEVKDAGGMDKMRSHLEQQEQNLIGDLDLYKIDTCMRSNCLDLEVKDINLVPLIERSPKINIDTYLSVRNLGNADFKYNGFIEVEVVLELPI